LNHKYRAQNQALQTWMESLVDSDLNVVTLEIGVGFNTPIVTRFPAEDLFARNLGDRAKFCRINPTEAEVPEDLRPVALEMGWEGLNPLKASQALPGSERQVRSRSRNICAKCKELPICSCQPNRTLDILVNSIGKVS
jgi:hypothetical protein